MKKRSIFPLTALILTLGFAASNMVWATEEFVWAELSPIHCKRSLEMSKDKSSLHRNQLVEKGRLDPPQRENQQFTAPDFSEEDDLLMEARTREPRRDVPWVCGGSRDFSDLSPEQCRELLDFILSELASAGF